MDVGGSALLPNALSTPMRKRNDGVAPVPHDLNRGLVAARNAVRLAVGFYEGQFGLLDKLP